MAPFGTGHYESERGLTMSIELSQPESDADRDRIIVAMFAAVGAAVERGETTTLTIEGQPVAKICPPGPHRGMQIGNHNVQSNVF